MKKFKNERELLDELEFIGEKMDFLREVTAALALRTETSGLSDAGLCGLYHIYRELEDQRASVSQALENDFYIVKKTDKEVHLNNFCATVESGIKTGGE